MLLCTIFLDDNETVVDLYLCMSLCYGSSVELTFYGLNVVLNFAHKKGNIWPLHAVLPVPPTRSHWQRWKDSGGFLTRDFILWEVQNAEKKAKEENQMENAVL